MKIHILSDLHLEFGKMPRRYEPPECDVIVLAGDIGVGLSGMDWAARKLPTDLPIVFVAGNHEFYGGRELAEHYCDLKAKAAKTPNITFLECLSREIAGVRFLGTTLWTDFDLFGNAPLHSVAAARSMNDFRCIKDFTPHVWLDYHRTARAWLRLNLREGFDGPTVVVSHHAPSELSVPQRYRADPLSAAYASRMEQTILEYSPDLWIHGHIHDSLDYKIGETRVVTNPRGYVGHELNPDFNIGLTVGIPLSPPPSTDRSA